MGSRRTSETCPNGHVSGVWQLRKVRDTKNMSIRTRFWCQNGGGWGWEPANIRNVPQWARFWCLVAEEKPRTPKTRPWGRVFGVRMDRRHQGGGGGGGVGTASGLGIS